jgi:hypothetical protein
MKIPQQYFFWLFSVDCSTLLERKFSNTKLRRRNLGKNLGKPSNLGGPPGDPLISQIFSQI